MATITKEEFVQAVVTNSADGKNAVSFGNGFVNELTGKSCTITTKAGLPVSVTTKFDLENLLGTISHVAAGIGLGILAKKKIVPALKKKAAKKVAESVDAADLAATIGNMMGGN